jgi:hypothetical protein
MEVVMTIMHASDLSDSELVSEMTRLARGEREATVALIVHLAEFDARRLCRGAGFPSTFSYCVEVLRLSEDAAYNRIEAARVARAFPAVLDMLVAGTLSPTTACMLRHRLTPENRDELLAAASGKTKREMEEVLARLFPQPDVPCSVHKLRSAQPAPSLVEPSAILPSHDALPTVPAPVAVSAPSKEVADGQPSAVSSLEFMNAPAPAPSPRPVVRPLSPERYEIRFTASAETREKLREAQELLSHAIPTGDLAQVFDRALTLLVEDLRKRRLGASRRPRKSRGQSENSRNIPADVRREVSERDDGHCAFVAPDGRRCGSRYLVQFHHHDSPYGVGGKPTAKNMQLRCRSHNQYESDEFYGPARRYAAGEVESAGGATGASAGGAGGPVGAAGARVGEAATRSGTGGSGPAAAVDRQRDEIVSLSDVIRTPVGGQIPATEWGVGEMRRTR